MNRINRRKWLATSALAGAGFLTLRGISETPHLKDESEMVLIPGGPFFLGTTPTDADRLARQYDHHPSWLGGELPGKTALVGAFHMDKFPVTNRRYLAFVRATAAQAPFDWVEGRPTEAQMELPVRYVERRHARAFAEWAGKRLPTAAEWEKTARGTDGRLYPWGNEFEPSACRHDRGDAAPPDGPALVTAHPRGASPYGVMDMIGNLAEYCGDQPGGGSAYLKGGCWLTSSPLNLRCASVGMSGAENNALDYIGFRCARTA